MTTTRHHVQRCSPDADLNARFVREVMPGVISAGGYSGHGVMLSNFMGKLYAETVAGNRDRLKLFEELKIPAFPGGRRFRTPLLFLALNWFALRDRI